MCLVVENDFGRLKGRCQVLRTMYTNHDVELQVQEVSVVPHKFREERDGASDDALEQEDDMSTESSLCACGDVAHNILSVVRHVHTWKALSLHCVV